jgi:hypothetical protein
MYQRQLLFSFVCVGFGCGLESPADSPSGVPSLPPPAAVCGDGFIADDELCDEGRSLEGSNCLEDCSVRPCGTEFAYQALWIRGFRVCLAQGLEDADAGLAAQALAALDEDIEQVASSLPSSALAYLKRVTIWLEHEQPFPGGVYHPSAGWLRNNGYPEAWAEGVMLGDAANYMSWVEQQPAMVLHELAHAWHHQRLGYDHQGIQAAYEAAMESGIYDQVAYVSGGTQEAYAKTNKMEYFAELTESWFWSNDFYPFVRSELLEHDELGARMVEESWTVDD